MKKSILFSFIALLTLSLSPLYTTVASADENQSRSIEQVISHYLEESSIRSQTVNRSKDALSHLDKEEIEALESTLLAQDNPTEEEKIIIDAIDVLETEHIYESYQIFMGVPLLAFGLYFIVAVSVELIRKSRNKATTTEEQK